jgi:transposase
VWTCERIGEVIRREFGVKYDPSHISRLMRQCGWSVQKPERRAIQRDEEAIAEWRNERWPELKKKPRTRA